jgi:hypothetical protein
MQEYERKSFRCSRLDDEATVELTYVTRPRNPEFPRVLGGFDCEDKDRCGVGSRSANGMSWSYNWKLCVHPDAPKGG